MPPLLPSTFTVAIFMTASLSLSTASTAGTTVPATGTTIPGTDYHLVIDPRTTDHRTPDRAMLDAVMAWLGKEFDLPPAPTFPDFAFASEEKLVSMWIDGIKTDDLASSPTKDTAPEIVALYDIPEKKIFLPETWSATSPVDVSVLVHEMVHHLQASAHTEFACPQEREKLAYAAQDKWLAMFGTSLEKEFEVDAFSLVFRTECMDME